MGSLKRSVRQAIRPLVSLLVERLSGSDIESLLAARARKSGSAIFTPEYPFDSKPRWTATAPHPEVLRTLDTGLDRYAELLSGFNRYLPRLAEIPAEKPEDATCPYWKNGWIPALDAIALYAFIASRRPKRYVEVGSGNSTKFARRAVRDHGLDTRIISIDPQPRAEINALCDTQMRCGLETLDLSLFEELGPDDIVFVDNSHRALMNSDVTTFFLDVLPRLKSGVLVGIHDIYWPLDYPDEWKGRFYSEQYLLAPLLLWKPGFDVQLPAFHVSVFPRQHLMAKMAPTWDGLPKDIERFGGAFWFNWS